MTLREKADKIINSIARSNDDIVELSQIGFSMSKQYSEANTLAWERERNYNKNRAEKSVEARKEGMAVWEANDVGKLYAEIHYWDYRKMKAECSWMKSVIDQIDSFKISYYRREKSLDGVLMSKS